jgi:hypothetical protein
LYDVVSIETENGKQIIYCISDSKEKTLINNYAAAKKETERNNKANKNILKFSITEFVEVNNNFLKITTQPPAQKYGYYNAILVCNNLSINIPPPKI